MLALQALRGPLRIGSCAQHSIFCCTGSGQQQGSQKGCACTHPSSSSSDEHTTSASPGGRLKAQGSKGDAPGAGDFSLCVLEHFCTCSHMHLAFVPRAPKTITPGYVTKRRRPGSEGQGGPPRMVRSLPKRALGFLNGMLF